ncbi:MAG: hypothetical protein Q4B94_07905 [Pseudomonadota bacterium]|nr:hypothetical protein [Pseudomonadota bacterium]
MIVGKKLLAGVLLLLAAPGAWAQRAVDATELSVSGVKLGMEWEAARRAASGFMQLPLSAIKPFELNNPITGRRQPMGFRIASANGSLLVRFSAEPELNGAIRVSAVEYEIPWSQENAERLRQAALEKYGAPSNAPESVNLQWCAHPNDNLGLGCADMGHQGQAEQAVLEAVGNKLLLQDRGAHIRMQRYLDSKRSTTPRF